jgi:hypothetical protein
MWPSDDDTLQQYGRLIRRGFPLGARSPLFSELMEPTSHRDDVGYSPRVRGIQAQPRSRWECRAGSSNSNAESREDIAGEFEGRPGVPFFVLSCLCGNPQVQFRPNWRARRKNAAATRIAEIKK